MNPIVYAIPVFFLLMAIEFLVARARGRAAYRLGDTIGSVGLGVYSQLTGLYARVLSFGIYVWVYESFRLFELPGDAVWVWLLALVAYDFCYYWNHRAGHEVALFWAAHVVHHQSEDYNLGTALRQSSSGFLLGWLFYLPMALLGFPPLVFAVVALIDLLYQYWIHTEQIGRLGWFDRVFASPSNHRVHHAVNDRYLDKNYGGILIVWDRLFGTFTEERDDDPPVYGTRKPLKSLDPVWANLEVYAELARTSLRGKGLRGRLLHWFKPPGWRADGVKPEFVLPPRSARFDPPLTPRAMVYAGLSFAFIVVVATWVLARFDDSLVRHAQLLWVLALLWALSRWCQATARWPAAVLALIWLLPIMAWPWHPIWLGGLSGLAVLPFGVFCAAGALGAWVAMRSNHASAAPAAQPELPSVAADS